MMKKVICVMMVIILAASFCGCGRETGEDFTSSGRFIIVSGYSSSAPYQETIIADKDTGVLYLVVYTGHQCGITPLLDADGKPLLREGT